MTEGGDIFYVACVGEFKDCCGKGLGGVGGMWLLGWGGLSCWGVRSCWLVVLRRRVRRLIFRSPELVSGVCSLFGSGDVGGCAMG